MRHKEIHSIEPGSFNRTGVRCFATTKRRSAEQGKSPKTVDHHISSIFFKLDVNSRVKAVREAVRQEIIK